MRQNVASQLRLHLGQRGQVLLIMLVILVMGVGMTFYTFVSPTSSAIERDKITAAALAQAKDALISYAAGQRTAGSYRPGDLPCPDRDGNGSADDGNCNTIGRRIGLLPWKTLGISDLRDSTGEKLWYAVSDNFKDNAQIVPLNSDTPGEYTVTGLTPANNVIAIVFAPGLALGLQNRSSTNAACTTTGTTIAQNLCADNYLESENANGDATFITALPSNTFNDKLMLITRDNFFPAVENRVAQELRQSLQSYYSSNRYYPFPASLTGTTMLVGTYRGRVPTAACSPLAGLTLPPWFSSNNWNQVMVYSVAPRCAPRIDGTYNFSFTQSSCNCVPWFSWWLCPSGPSINAGSRDCNNTAAGPYLTVTGVSNAVEAVLLSAGYTLSGQSRPSSSISNYLEAVGSDAENIDTPDNYIYIRPQRSSTNNDRLVVVRP